MGVHMKTSVVVIVLMLCTLGMMGGCSNPWGSAGLGAAGGAAAAGGGYEYVANREMKRIDEDLKSGKIDQREYDIRKDQIKRMSILE
jgi:hypothetical protein